MNIPLSPRLAACARFVEPGSRVADIGCDHGYLGLHLLQTGLAAHVYAADINEGPLQSALHNAHKFGFQDAMSFYLSDGLRNVPRDFESMICAGMGADTMISILQDAPWLRCTGYRLILQCQSRTHALRKYLSENGWKISREDALRDGKFLYTVMLAEFAPQTPPLTPGQWYISPALAQCSSPEAAQYCSRILDGLRLAAAHDPDGEKALALTELEHR